MKLQSPRGTADLMPDEMARHRKVMDTARHLGGRFGFEEMATPIFEFTDVFARPLGEGSDVVTKETYSFTDRGGEGLTLRPEGTAGVVRAYFSRADPDPAAEVFLQRADVPLRTSAERPHAPVSPDRCRIAWPRPAAG